MWPVRLMNTLWAVQEWVILRRLSSIKTAYNEFPAHFFNDFDTAPAVLRDVTRGFVLQRIEMQLPSMDTAFLPSLVL